MKNKKIRQSIVFLNNKNILIIYETYMCVNPQENISQLLIFNQVFSMHYFV